MDDHRVADYFIVAGFDEKAEVLKVTDETEANAKENLRDPITDLAVINRSEHELVPEGYVCVELTPSGFNADLNYGSFRCPELYLCYRRGRDKPPLVHIGVVFEGRDKVLPHCEVIRETPGGRCANVNNTNSHRTFITFKRASPRSNPNDLVVTDVCVVIKDEKPPHTFWKISDRNLNNALLGSDVFLCYKKATGNRNFITYQPALLFRYPQHDHSSLPLPVDVQLFSMPMGASLEAWPREAESPRPIFAKFVLTVSGNRNQVYGAGKFVQKLYGAALTFYEPYPREKLKPEQKKDLLKTLREEDAGFHVNKSICILSKWPFFDAFQTVLHHLLSMSFSNSQHSVPIERVISHFIREVPFPSAYRPKVLVQMTGNNSMPIALTRPGDSPISLNGASFSTMVKNLSPENCASILLMSLLEQKICLHSLRPDVLTAVAESVTSIIFPFVWQCSYVPLCPLGLCDLLHAPVPFVVGVDSRYFELYDPPLDVIYVDLDTNSIEIPKDKLDANLKTMPKKPVKALMEKLDKITKKMAEEAAKNMTDKKKVNPATATPGEREFKQKIRTRQFDTEIQEAFLSFMVSILKGYRSFLKPMVRAPAEGATDPGALFDIAGFLKSRDRSYSKFFDSLMHTQQFIRFIEERSIMSDREASYSMAFFDECVQRVEKEGTLEISLIDTDEMLNERTVFIPPPENEKSTEKFVYGKGFPALRYEFFDDVPFHDGTQISDAGEREVKNTGPSSDFVTTRTKQEVKAFQSYAQYANQHPKRWAKCLLSTGYALWFMYLPSLVASSNSPSRTLRNAFDTLKRMLHARIQPSDEVAYRIMMQLCGKYSQPALAVKVLSEMKNYKIQPDAVTYGFYNKVVFESTWPSASHSPYMLWMKTKHVIRGVALFREAGAQRRRNSRKNDETDSKSQCLDNTSDEGKGTRGSSDTGFFSLDQDAKRNSMMSLTSGEFMASIAELKSNETAADENSADITLDTSATLVPDSSPNKPAEVPSTPTFEIYPFETNCIVRKSTGSAGKSRISSVGGIRSGQKENDTGFNSAGLLMVHRSRRHTADKTISGSSKGKHRRHKSWTEGMRRSSTSNKRQHLSTSGLNLSPRQHLKKPVAVSRKDSLKESITKAHRSVSPPSRLDFSNETVVVLEETVRTVDIPSPMSDFPSEDEDAVFGMHRRSLKSMSVPRDSGSTDSLPRMPGSVSIEFASSTLPKLGAFIRNSKSYSSIKKFWNTGDRKKSRDGDMGSSVESSPLVKGSAALMSGMKSVTSALGKRIGEISTTLTTASSDSGSSRIGSSLRDLPGALNFTDYGFDSFGPMTPSQDWNEEEEDISAGDEVDAAPSSVKSWEFPSYQFSPRHTYRPDGTGHGDCNILVHVDIGSVVACHKCETPVYDEEVLAGFYPDESNLNARCPYCATKFLPLLTIAVYDHIEVDEEIKDAELDVNAYDANCPLLKFAAKSASVSITTVDKRASSLFSSQDNISSHSAAADSSAELNGLEPMDPAVVPTVEMLRAEETASLNSNQGGPSEDVSQSNSICGRTNRCKLRSAITVPYLSPLVLRKELETLIVNKGDTCLCDPDFVQSHHIIYWNLLWYCDRMSLPQSLSGMLLDVDALRLLSQLGHSLTLTSRSRYVHVSCRWDNPEIHPHLGVPMYITYGEEGSVSSQLNALGIEESIRVIPRHLMGQMLQKIRDDSDLESPMRMFLHGLQKRQDQRHRSMYRELLFLAIRALDSENIDRMAFDKVYKPAFQSLRKDEDFISILQADDRPPSVTAGWCRQAFRPLQI